MPVEHIQLVQLGHIKNAYRKLVTSLIAALVDNGKFDDHEGNWMIIKKMFVSVIFLCNLVRYDYTKNANREHDWCSF